MRYTIVLAFFLALMAGGHALAQSPPAEEPEPAVEGAEEAAAEAADAEPEEAAAEAEPEEEALPDIDVWAEEPEDDDGYIPTERISADSSIAYPADI